MLTELFKDKFDAIRFVMAENLPQDLWNVSPQKRGLVIVATKINSVPRDIVIGLPENMSPVEVIKKIGIEEGITAKKIDDLIEQLEKSEKEEIKEEKEE